MRVDDLIRKHYTDIPRGESVLATLIEEAIAEKRFPILDAGCGTKAKWIQRFGAFGPIVGVDLDTEFPPGLPIARANLAELPFGDASFSFIFSRSVFEHLPEPTNVLNEFGRVLKPRGRCAILTPNFYDYSSIIAWATPHSFHEKFISKLYGARAYDPFPVLYRSNTPRYFLDFARENKGWKIVRISGLRHYPANLSFSRILFRIGIVYDKFIARMNWISLQPSLLVVLEKTAVPE
jgi:SAM-dependent methyltransferase